MTDGLTIHFVGIGGIGMSGIAHLLLEAGEAVSGSDVKESQQTRELAAKGARIYIGHAAENVHGAREVVVSSAIRPTNPEIIEARRLGIPIRHRSEKLAELLDARRGITIAGTHGKTTTSSMAATLLATAGLNPSYAVGGVINTADSNAAGGGSEWFVAEADESDGSLVNFHPEIAIITNVELDHTDYYENLEQVYNVFLAHLKNIKAGGSVVACVDDPGVREVLSRAGLSLPLQSGCSRLPNDVRVMGYGTTEEAELRAEGIESNGFGYTYTAVQNGERLGRFSLNVPGQHNVLNSLAVIALGRIVGLDTETIARGIAAFRGVRRRFQVIAKTEQVTIVDDYAHHPTELKATLAAARSLHAGRIVAIFQPHRYSRTQSLAREFGAAFHDADVVVLTDIYPASEDPIAGVTSELILQALAENHHPAAFYVGSLEAAEEFVAANVRPGDMILTLGAGDITKCGPSLARRLGCK
ncbi:MAG: UDP-N-acetylmuramate--L-alanine ligase [Candidatus Sumerlaea sp.]|uniref:UDP-N-acetylmuramate--L-alanine ligase n=1 Tax=Sumerlaea chitinivorans TaxID=2250252 RepID=A0A2Z4Y5Z8_SUMC1|nr:UDP-N-acetylmuramate--alanine ligase [Candidatus Sumerlaea chitinivorans]MCX7964484.1 UDP-N-acetylmuramate--L-alanine ligase [Candidatus Sumerlaea chitinivorans]GIX45644.1 MAG: UDP-N-acetylmuramate--L-alanine ligase [Candidatus Sumerlaea sp.]